MMMKYVRRLHATCDMQHAPIETLSSRVGSLIVMIRSSSNWRGATKMTET
jgi:hypothetical protein